MNWTDDELKEELAKLLNAPTPNSDSMMHYICYLARTEHNVDVMVGWSEPWQEQARHILRHMAAREAVAESKA